MGVRFNYRQDHRQNWLCIITVMIAIFAVILITLSSLDNFFYKYLANSQMQLALIQFIDFVQTSMSLMIATTFTILLRALHKRFAVLNSFLRWWTVDNSCSRLLTLFVSLFNPLVSEMFFWIELIGMDWIRIVERCHWNASTLWLDNTSLYVTPQTSSIFAIQFKWSF